MKWVFVDEERFWREKARVQWLREGDKNTSLFHIIVSQRHSRVFMRGLDEDDGVWRTNRTELGSIVSRP